MISSQFMPNKNLQYQEQVSIEKGALFFWDCQSVKKKLNNFSANVNKKSCFEDCFRVAGGLYFGIFEIQPLSPLPRLTKRI